RIRVSEREPIAQVQQPFGPGVRDPGVFTLDAKGYVMLPVAAQQRSVPWSGTNECLPWIIGVNQLELRPGKPVDSYQVKAALKLITEFERSSMAAAADIRVIDLSSPETMTVTTGQGCKVTFGTEKVEVQLNRWWAIHRRF